MIMVNLIVIDEHGCVKAFQKCYGEFVIAGHAAGISKKCIKLRPVAVIKG